MRREKRLTGLSRMMQTPCRRAHGTQWRRAVTGIEAPGFPEGEAQPQSAPQAMRSNDSLTRTRLGWEPGSTLPALEPGQISVSREWGERGAPWLLEISRDGQYSSCPALRNAHRWRPACKWWGGPGTRRGRLQVSSRQLQSAGSRDKPRPVPWPNSNSQKAWAHRWDLEPEVLVSRVSLACSNGYSLHSPPCGPQGRWLPTPHPTAQVPRGGGPRAAGTGWKADEVKNGVPPPRPQLCSQDAEGQARAPRQEDGGAGSGRLTQTGGHQHGQPPEKQQSPPTITVTSSSTHSSQKALQASLLKQQTG